MSFSLQAGFEDGESSTDTTTSIGGSQVGGGGGGNGMIIGGKYLEITGESVVSNPSFEGSAVISWQTNIPATSQVIYGLSSDGPYNLSLVGVNFGYPFASDEIDLGKVTTHQIVLTGLIIGETYSYRVVSRASPPTVGYEYTFSLKPDGSIDSVTNSVVNQNVVAVDMGQSVNGLGLVQNVKTEENSVYMGLGNSPEIFEDGALDSNSSSINKNRLSAAIVSAGNWPVSFIFKILFFLLILFLIFIIFTKRRKKSNL